jgi:hypothetical protein
MTIGMALLTLSTCMAQNVLNEKLPDQFPTLPYAYNALEQYIDAATMEVHYS